MPPVVVPRYSEFAPPQATMQLQQQQQQRQQQNYGYGQSSSYSSGMMSPASSSGAGGQSPYQMNFVDGEFGQVFHSVWLVLSFSSSGKFSFYFRLAALFAIHRIRPQLLRSQPYAISGKHRIWVAIRSRCWFSPSMKIDCRLESISTLN